MPSWNATNATFASVIYGDWNCIFYIDTNRQLQFLRSVDGGQSWSVQQPMESSSWPLADEPNAPITAATSINATDDTTSVYYNSGQKLVQVRMTNSTWLPYSFVEAAAIAS